MRNFGRVSLLLLRCASAFAFAAAITLLPAVPASAATGNQPSLAPAYVTQGATETFSVLVRSTANDPVRCIRLTLPAGWVAPAGQTNFVVSGATFSDGTWGPPAFA